MATTIIQRPAYNIVPIGSELIFIAQNDLLVANNTQVKFIAEVFISSTTTPDMSLPDDEIGVFKTTPNNAGVGIFDLSSVVENYISSDNIAFSNSQYKDEIQTDESIVPIHLIDKYSMNKNSFKWLSIKFKVEYLDTSVTPNILITREPVSSLVYQVFNGYLKENTDELFRISGNYGYPMTKFTFSGLFGVGRQFLTNAPTTQYANIGDYGTIGLLLNNPISKSGGPAGASNPTSIGVKIVYYDDTDHPIASDSLPHNVLNGAISYANGNVFSRMLFLGIFPGNLVQWSTNFQTLQTSISYYKFYVYMSNQGTAGTKTYRININCPTLKGYKPVRLAWLNQWGTWDYYTFTMKSSVSISTKKTKYEQLQGTWNKESYRVLGYKGGQKTFRVNATERIKMNTDFLSESESEWFEELINSPEVYILEGWQKWAYSPTSKVKAALNQYVTPVVLKTSSWKKKTKANDKLIQYTFEVEKSKLLKTQAI